MKGRYEHIRLPQLERMYTGVTHKKEELQKKMAADMGRIGYHDILPRNFSIIPEIQECSLHDLTQLEELDETCFDICWAIEKKKHEQKGTLHVYEASFKFYSFRDVLSDVEIDRFFKKLPGMNSNTIIQELIKNPRFLEEVTV